MLARLEPRAPRRVSTPNLDAGRDGTTGRQHPAGPQRADRRARRSAADGPGGDRGRRCVRNPVSGLLPATDAIPARDAAPDVAGGRSAGRHDAGRLAQGAYVGWDVAVVDVAVRDRVSPGAQGLAAQRPGDGGDRRSADSAGSRTGWRTAA